MTMMKSLKNWDYLFKYTQNYLNPENEKLQWLISLRNYVLLVQIPLSFLGYILGYLNSATLSIFLITITLFLVYNFYLRKKKTDTVVTYQMMLDVLTFTILLILSGGESNPFYVFYYVFAVLGGILTGGRRSLWFLLVLLLCVLFIQFFGVPRVDLIHLFAQLLVPTIIFIVSRSLGEHLNLHQKHLVQLALTNAKLDRLRALGSLSAGFSHEFSSPLNTIKLRINRLKKNQTESEDLLEIEEAAKECELVLRRMNASQLDHRSSIPELAHSPTLVKQIVEKWKNEHPDVEVGLDISQENTFIKVTTINFAQTLLNLLDNALEADPTQKKIQLCLSSTPSETILTVEDFGKGFSEEILKHLGEPFNTSKTHGTGLGLYSVYLFMDSVLGNVHVQNKKNQNGALVSLHFPRQDKL